jgi:hypothetical protein
MGAQWCSLCFADLREPAPVREPVSVPARAGSVAAVAPDAGADPAMLAHDVAPIPVPVAAHAASILAGTALDPHTPLPGLSRPTVPAAAVTPSPAAAPVTAVAEATWPCPRCGDQVAISLDICGSCGAGFLSGASTTMSARLPMVGDVTQMSSGQRWLLAMGISAVFAIMLVIVLFIVGKVL